MPSYVPFQTPRLVPSGCDDDLTSVIFCFSPPFAVGTASLPNSALAISWSACASFICSRASAAAKAARSASDLTCPPLAKSRKAWTSGVIWVVPFCSGGGEVVRAGAFLAGEGARDAFSSRLLTQAQRQGR